MSWPPDGVLVAADSVATFVPTDGSDPVLFDAATAQVHRLVGPSATVWAAIDGTRTVAAVIDLVSALHRTDVVDSTPAIEATLHDLTSLGLIMVVASGHP